jgi:hypothetical protein
MPIYEQKKEDPAAATIAFCKWLTYDVEAWENKARADLAGRMVLGDVFQVLMGDVPIGSVSLRRRGQKLTVLNERLFIQWVAERWPEQVEQRVNPDFVKVLAGRARQFNGVLTDYQGEVCEHAYMTGQVAVLQMNVLDENVSAIAATNGIRERLQALHEDITRLTQPTGEGGES